MPVRSPTVSYETRLLTPKSKPYARIREKPYVPMYLRILESRQIGRPTSVRRSDKAKLWRQESESAPHSHRLTAGVLVWQEF
jgi:hypothetical protein